MLLVVEQDIYAIQARLGSVVISSPWEEISVTGWLHSWNEMQNRSGLSLENRLQLVQYVACWAIIEFPQLSVQKSRFLEFLSRGMTSKDAQNYPVLCYTIFLMWSRFVGKYFMV